MSPFSKILIPLGFYCVFILGCNSFKSSSPRKSFPPLTSFPPTLKSARLIEQGIGSKDISYNHLVEIDTGLYPNRLNYLLTKVKRYQRPSQEEGLNYIIEYFASSDDSVRTIVHEWAVAANSSLAYDEAKVTDLNLPQAAVIEVFKNKFEFLDSTFTSSLGLPVLKNIRGNYFEDSERDDIKWLGQNPVNVYLLMFKRDKNTYREIRTIVFMK